MGLAAHTMLAAERLVRSAIAAIDLVPVRQQIAGTADTCLDTHTDRALAIEAAYSLQHSHRPRPRS